MMLVFRPLRADEIELRIGTINQNGLSLLLYKNARCDMNILDETVGTENWCDEFYEAKGTLFCRIGIRVEPFDRDEWVYKGDAGSPSNMEAIKGEASDARKRAGAVWGIGRELYTAPFIWIKAEDAEIVTNAKGKLESKARFSVKSITIEDKAIKSLTISNGEKIVFTYGVQNPTKILCPKCGKKIEGYTGRSGAWYSPEEVFKRHGKCIECVKAERNAE